MKLAPIFIFSSNGNKKIEIIPKSKKARRKKVKIQEKIEKIPKIYTYFSVLQDSHENEPNITQLNPTKIPPKHPQATTNTEDQGGGGLSKGLMETTRRILPPKSAQDDHLSNFDC